MTLSDYVNKNELTGTEWVKAEFVKQFIKELKREINKHWLKEDDVYQFTKEEMENIIDKLAGSKLIDSPRVSGSISGDIKPADSPYSVVATRGDVSKTDPVEGSTPSADLTSETPGIPVNDARPQKVKSKLSKSSRVQSEGEDVCECGHTHICEFGCGIHSLCRDDNCRCVKFKPKQEDG